MNYLHRYDKYDPEQIGEILLGKSLFHEAFYAYDKAEWYKKALKILVEDIGDTKAAQEYEKKAKDSIL